MTTHESASNEIAVEAFMAGRIAFGEISEVVQRTITGHRLQARPSLVDLIEADRRARVAAGRIIEEMNGFSASKASGQ